MMPVTFNNFARLAQAMHRGASAIVTETCSALRDEYAATCAYDTGFMSSSAYISTAQEDTYGQGVVAGKAGATLLPDIGAPPDDTTGYMAVGASYAIYPELGTRYQPPHPAFYPAVETIRPHFIEQMSHLESRMK